MASESSPGGQADSEATQRRRVSGYTTAPKELAEGATPTEIFDVYAASRDVRRFVLDGYERISWQCRVLDGYNVDFCVKVSSAKRRSEIVCEGARVGLKGVDGVRVVVERERGVEFNGYLDLGDEHAGCLGDTDNMLQSDMEPVLTLEFDNTFSYFTSKTIELKLQKVCGAPRTASGYTKAVAACEPKGEWSRAMRLLGRMRDVGVAGDVSTYNAALRVCKAARKWRSALELLDTMRREGIMPDAQSYSAAISACESDGQAELALRLMDSMDAVLDASSAGIGTQEDLGAAESLEASSDLAWLRWAFTEAARRCPPAASELRGHIAAAQASLDEYTVLKGG